MFLQSIFAAAKLSHATWSALKTSVQILRIQQFKVGSKKKKKKKGGALRFKGQLREQNVLKSWQQPFLFSF